MPAQICEGPAGDEHWSVWGEEVELQCHSAPSTLSHTESPRSPKVGACKVWEKQVSELSLKKSFGLVIKAWWRRRLRRRRGSPRHQKAAVFSWMSQTITETQKTPFSPNCCLYEIMHQKMLYSVPFPCSCLAAIFKLDIDILLYSPPICHLLWTLVIFQTITFYYVVTHLCFGGSRDTFCLFGRKGGTSLLSLFTPNFFIRLSRSRRESHVLWE